jgi:hypothetical protein
VEEAAGETAAEELPAEPATPGSEPEAGERSE